MKNYIAPKIETPSAVKAGIRARRPLAKGPCFDLSETEVGGVLCYTSSGYDPQMVLLDARDNSTLTCEPGRYRLVFQARLSRGAIRRPRLYLDFGEGFSEAPESNVFIQKWATDTWVGEFETRRRINQIRFDPSESMVRFALLRLEMLTLGSVGIHPAEGLYLIARAAYLGLPFAVRRIRPVTRAAEFLASGVFGSARAAYRERLSLLSAAPDISAPPVDRLEPTADHGSVYAHQYFETVAVASGARDPSYAPLRADPAPVAPSDPKIVAFYLPQFHPIAENDAWWGRGFTEWTNVSKATAQFKDHYQPRLPGELGFYDLRLADVMKRQIELAKLYGLSGFCFHFYWFGEKRLLERPVDLFLSQSGLDFEFEFCLCWANENWTRRWDGSENEILMQQNHTPEDHEKVFCELLRYISDKRYMRIDGRPVVIIYRPAIIPDVQEMVAIWRAAAARAGVPPPYLVATTAFGFSDPGSINFDGLVQFPPHAVSVGEMNDQIQLLNPGFVGTVYDYGETVTAFTQNLEDLREKPRTTAFFPGVMTGWDNEARKPGRGHVFHNATPSGFHQWLKQALAFSSAYNRPSEQIVFINAWNEWAEGTYLEPDRRYGYAYLSAVAAARAERLPAPTALLTLAAALDTPPTSDAVICCHCFYEDLIDEFAGVIAEARRVRRFDVILSVPPHWTPEALAFAIAAISPVRVIVSENRGRDVWPFIQSLRLARGLGYTFGCKVHSKKSLHLPAGERWRHGLIGGLLGEDAVRAAVEIFDRDPKAGLVAPTEAFFDTHDENAARANRPAMAALLKRFDAGAAPAGKFVAGTMFWFRVAALERLALSDLDAEDFGPELGAVDGTVAHAFERLFPTMVAAAGYAIGDYPAPDAKPPY